jgi:Homeodomain-like domain
MISAGQLGDRAWCARQLAAGDTVAAIAKKCHVSLQTASAWLKRHGLRANHQPYERPDTAQMAATYARLQSIRKLGTHYGISLAVMRTWLFEAGIAPLGTPGRPRPRRRSRGSASASCRRRHPQGDRQRSHSQPRNAPPPDRPRSMRPHRPITQLPSH